MPERILASLLLLLIYSSNSLTLGQDIGIFSKGARSPIKEKKPEARKPTPKQPTKPIASAKLKKRANLTIITKPEECEVYLNDTYRGTTTTRSGKLVIPDLDTSLKYTLRIYKRGVGEELQTIELDSDRELTIALNNSSEKSSEAANNPPPDKQTEKVVATKIPDSSASDSTTNNDSNNGTSKAAIKPPQSDMVLIPAGEFIMGLDKGPTDNEKPMRKVYLEAFYIDVHEVTNGEYKLFCEATGRSHPKNPE
ncbi:MAG: SUMF1/EgtB/PvdO family nonheme iron enzyme, partial [Acidobacteriota bacterium]